MPTLLLTGGNRGIGFEAATQFASTGLFDRIILTVRTADKGPAAITAAADKSKKPESLFSFTTIDLNAHDSVRAAVQSLPSIIDAVVLNAGGLGTESLTAHGVTENFAMNVLGHVVLVEGLLTAGKIGPGARVVYSHSEATRSIWLFTGFQPFVRLYKEEMEGSLAHPPSRGSYGVGVRQRMNTYSNSKLIGGLWLSTLAKEHPAIYFVSISPGGCCTDVYKSAPQPFPFLMGLKPIVAVFNAIGACHSAEAAAKRYVSAITDDTFVERFPSGAVVGGPYIQIAKADGRLVNQSEFSPYYTDTELQSEAAFVVRAAVKR